MLLIKTYNDGDLFINLNTFWFDLCLISYCQNYYKSIFSGQYVQVPGHFSFILEWDKSYYEKIFEVLGGKPNIRTTTYTRK